MAASTCRARRRIGKRAMIARKSSPTMFGSINVDRKRVKKPGCASTIAASAISASSPEKNALTSANNTVADISVETLAELAKLPNIVGIKDATGNLARVTGQA